MRVAVYCGSRSGDDPEFAHEAKRLGTYLGEQKIGLVYGGGHVGLMGVVADAALAAGGEVFGVIPEKLFEREVGHQGLTEMFIVDDMHQRKSKMMDLADAFIAMPGGAGTLEEIFEAFTWKQIGYHEKPCALFNVLSFFDPLLDMLELMSERGFLDENDFESLIVEFEPSVLLEKIFPA